MTILRGVLRHQGTLSDSLHDLGLARLQQIAQIPLESGANIAVILLG